MQVQRMLMLVGWWSNMCLNKLWQAQQSSAPELQLQLRMQNMALAAAYIASMTSDLSCAENFVLVLSCAMAFRSA